MNFWLFPLPKFKTLGAGKTRWGGGRFIFIFSVFEEANFFGCRDYAGKKDLWEKGLL